MILSNYLSIWEISHRWHNIDPNKTDPQNLPFEIQDTLRLLCRLILSGKLTLLNEVFYHNPDEQGTNRFEQMVYEVDEIPSEFQSCASDRVYNKSALDSYCLNRTDLFYTCAHQDISFPDFWFDELLAATIGAVYVPAGTPKETREQAKLTARQSVIDKELCQAIARTLWDIKPDTRIAEMTRHKAIQQYGNGRLYTGKNTLADWLREVAPEHIKNKPGRPKRKASNDAV